MQIKEIIAIGKLNIQTLKHPFAVFSTTGLFNGNISAMTVSNHALGNALAYAYQYDQLNRLITKTSWKGLDTAVNRWTPVALPDYKESLRYDANGNILTNNRYGDAHKGQMDQLTYYYKTGTNQLRHVKDAIAAAGYSTDIDDQQPDNYSYDAIGNLIADKSERIDTISWTVYGKIAGIKKRNGTIRYKYDAAGNRVYKQSVLDGKTNTSFYVRDAQGNVLGVYDLNEKGLSWEEQHLYGSSRLGVYRYGATMPLQSVTTKSAAAVVQDSMAWGSRVYELSNHLGNVLATVSDKKLQVAGTGNTVAYYRAETLSANDYFAFGSLIEDRSFAVGNGYRYGFNGKENDNEVKGEGNQQDYGMRIYDPRIGKFLSVDPLASKYPEWSPYSAMANNPIMFFDADGREPIPSYRRFFGEPRKAWQWYSTAGIYDSKTFNSAAAYSTTHLRTSSFQDISQRNAYYGWADGQVSSKSRWFGAAEIVTRWNAVGAAEGINAWYLDKPAEKFLSAGNKYLFGFNMANAKSLINNGGLSGSFNDANGSNVKFDGLSGKALDYAMVQFEQTKVQDFIGQYQKDNPNANMADIIKTINGSFSAFGAPGEIKKVMNENFNPDKGQSSFDFGNYNDRVKLGQKIVDQLYEKK